MSRSLYINTIRNCFPSTQRKNSNTTTIDLSLWQVVKNCNSLCRGPIQVRSGVITTKGKKQLVKVASQVENDVDMRKTLIGWPEFSIPRVTDEENFSSLLT